MASYEYYVARGYDAATAEAFAKADEESPWPPSQSAPPVAPLDPQPGAFPVNPALWFEGQNPRTPPPAPPGGAPPEPGRFVDLGRMAEAERDEAELVEQRVRAYRESQPPVKPDETKEVGGMKIDVYLDANAREVNRREAAVKKIREGGRA